MARRRGITWKWGYVWVTLLLFAFSAVGHWIFAWFDYVDEQQAHGQPVEVSEYLVRTGAATLENWQSEFLQLLWQVAGLAVLYCVGSPQSKEGSERTEAKLDQLMRMVDKQAADRHIAELDARYERR